MNDQHPHDWEASLRQRATQFEYPPTPDIARAVRRRTHHAGPVPHRQTRLLPVLAVVALAVLLLWPLGTPLRAAVERLWKIGAVEIIVATPVPATPTQSAATPAPATPTQSAATPSPTPSTQLATTPTSGLSVPQPIMAGQTTLAEARERVPFEIRLPTYPTDLGPPDQVFVQIIDGTALIMVWLEPESQQAQLSLQVLNSDVVARKLLFMDNQAQRTTVNNQPAVWIDIPHVFEYVVPGGQPHLQEGRFVQGNVLIWVSDTLTYRLESNLPLDEARRIAESVR